MKKYLDAVAAENAKWGLDRLCGKINGKWTVHIVGFLSTI